MKEKIFISCHFLVIVLLCLSCNKEEADYHSDNERHSVGVAFVPYSNTRAGDTAFEVGDLISVYASTNDKGEILASGNYASNEKYSYVGGQFIQVGKGIPFYKGDGVYDINYYAIYPYHEKEEISFVFTVGEDQSTHENYTKNDLMLGYNGATTADPVVPLKFRHMLGQVVVNTEHADLEGQNPSLIFLSDIDKVNVNLAKLTVIRKDNGTRPIDIAMCPDGLNLFKAVAPPQKMVAKSVVVYVIVNGRTRLARLEKDVNLHSGKSVLWNLYPLDDTNEYILRQVETEK